VVNISGFKPENRGSNPLGPEMKQQRYNRKRGLVRLSINKRNLLLTTKDSNSIYVLEFPGKPKLVTNQPNLKSDKISDKQFKITKDIRYFYGPISYRSYSTLLSLANKQHTNILNILESRLDVLVFRLQFARSLFQARSLIKQGKIKVNNSICRNPNSIITIGSSITCTSPETPATLLARSYLSFFPIPDHLILTSFNTGVLLATANISSLPYPQYFSLDKIIT
jgi:ribosomal protein S4